MTQHVNSTSDERTANNTVRHQYRILTDEEKARMSEIKDHGAEFLRMCDDAGQSREMNIAKTRIEEAVMWVVKHITR